MLNSLQKHTMLHLSRRAEEDGIEAPPKAQMKKDDGKNKFPTP